jgi:hypothetical protein
MKYTCTLVRVLTSYAQIKDDSKRPIIQNFGL